MMISRLLTFARRAPLLLAVAISCNACGSSNTVYEVTVGDQAAQKWDGSQSFITGDVLEGLRVRIQQGEIESKPVLLVSVSTPIFARFASTDGRGAGFDAMVDFTLQQYVCRMREGLGCRIETSRGDLISVKPTEGA